MELLYELESQADEFIVEWMRRTIADALLFERFNREMRARERMGGAWTSP